MTGTRLDRRRRGLPAADPRRQGAATALMAWFIFHESFNRRVVLGMIRLVAGAAALAWTGTPMLTSIGTEPGFNGHAAPRAAGQPGFNKV